MSEKYETLTKIQLRSERDIISPNKNVANVKRKKMIYFPCSLVIRGNRYNVTGDIGQPMGKNNTQQLKEIGSVNTGKTSSGIL